ncbi:hotdog family protein [Microbulbifer spongiae]|uniref:Hotdog family protein n=1 Tax=Microbulbifer spongiae TaxID=2944933 RepID=A0ABY9EAB2_9GAMM|nr:hotdog family protein [Microbulbifer sp. MI-G]WKD49943.1 hotdog family protein [Microbulbifer sp. MI-G]
MQKYTAEELVPHSGGMSLLDEILLVEEDKLKAKLQVRDDGLFSRDKRVPAYVGIEYMAQAIAAFSGYHAKEKSEDIRLGFLLGTRKFVSNIESYQCGDEITIQAERLLQAENGMATFECRITGSGVEQNARLSVYQPDNVEVFLKEKS